MMRCVAAIDARRGLATDQGIPWELPTDQRFFVDQTRDGLVLMGFGTYVEFDAPMHGRTNYVATRRAEDLLPGFVAVHDVPAFVTAHRDERIDNIGGAGLFHSTLQLADELVLTRIRADFHCTKFFPEFEHAFRCVSQSEPVTENGTEFVFETWRPRTDVL
ncbi:MAG TPA: dihydrofolate reductase [Nakamurella sp.]|jgi:dihydrofolate reductase|nr:dihydrofolate reductase [Nakamurella sp.]